MLNKIFKDKNKKYCFTINNTFHIIYFLSIKENFNLKNTLFLINNTNNFFISGGYDIIFSKNNLSYILLNGENYFRKFPYSIVDIFKYKKEVKVKLKNIIGYNFVVSQDSTISNNIILNYLYFNNNFLVLIDTTAYSLIKDTKKGIKYYLFKLYLKFFGIYRGIKSGEYFQYTYKLFSNQIKKTILSKNINYLQKIFSEKIQKLSNIESNKNIIFLSQNIIDEYGIEPNLFIEKLLIIEKYYKNLGYDFYIKPHPMENTSYYENTFKLIDKSIPSELFDIYFGNKDTIYITFFSTVISNLQFGKKYLIGDIGFGENEISIINLLHKNFNIPFLNISKK